MRRPARLASNLALATLIAWAPMGARSAAAAQPEAIDMAGFLASFWPQAAAHDISRAVFDAAFAGVAPDPSVAAMTAKQPEFVKPIGAYLATQVTPARIAEGRARAQRWAAELAAIEGRFGVPASVLVAVWGLETGYGASTGDKDVIRSLATLAAAGYRSDLYRGELVAALTLLQSGEVTRTDLRGSWAGAMGQPQFMPSSFAAYAVDEDGDGRRDIWSDIPDSLASIANFLHAKGWQSGQPWGFEVRLPPGFDVGTGRGTFAVWTARGLRRVDGRALPETGEAALFFPAGAAGPAFLVTPNYEVLKTYNFSDAYVLSVAELAGRMAGDGPIVGAWPSATPMSRTSRIALQARLVDLGYPVDDRAGRISLALRDVIRLAQHRAGLVPDGNPTDGLLAALKGVRAQNR